MIKLHANRWKKYEFGATTVYDMRNLEREICQCTRQGKTVCKIDLRATCEALKNKPPYRAISTSHKKTLGILLERWLKNGYRVLDIGCAEGITWDQIQIDLELHGLDQCVRRLGLYPYIGRDKLGGLNPKFRSLAISDAENLPYENNSFNVCVSLEVIEHIIDVDAFLAEIHRVLRPGGRIILSTPNIAALKHRLGLLFGKGLGLNLRFWRGEFYPLAEYRGRPYSPDGIRYPEQLQHIRFFTHESMARTLDMAGFDEIESFGMSGWLNGRKASKQFGLISRMLATSRFKTFLLRIFCTAIKPM